MPAEPLPSKRVKSGSEQDVVFSENHGLLRPKELGRYKAIHIKGLPEVPPCGVVWICWRPPKKLQKLCWPTNDHATQSANP